MRKILIITGDKCDDTELFYPYYRLIEENYNIDIASVGKKTVTAKYHFTIDADCDVCDVNEKEYCALILPGGSAPEKLRLNETILKIVRKFDELKKPIAAICHGPQVLISAGILKGRRATGYKGISDDIRNCGAIYENEKVVVCGNIVTSRCPEDLPFFMREFIQIIDKQ